MSTVTTNERPRILVIDDNDAIHADFRKTLVREEVASTSLTLTKAVLFSKSGPSETPSVQMPKFEIQSAMQGQEGLSKLEEAIKEGRPYRVAFVDMRMPPGWDGVQTIQRLWQADPNVQVVICTAYSDYSWEEISKKLGLTDRLLILKKPFDPLEITQIATSLSEKWLLKQKAHIKAEEPERLVSERTAELVHAALHDKLTDLPNRALLRDRITLALERKKRNPDYHFAVLFLDFDRFKVVNDSLGHQAGDELLKAISGRLIKTMRGTDSVGRDDATTAARLGGDEFVVLTEDMKQVGDCGRVAERLLSVLSEPYDLSGHKVNSTASIGITTSSIPYKNADEMLRDADTAMYHAKAAGKARYVLFDREMHEQVTERLQMESDLLHAVERNELLLNYQPVVSLLDGKLLGFEALVRWNHPKRGIVPPSKFIPCGEETTLIGQIGFWVLREACTQFRKWQETCPNCEDHSISVNLSARQLSIPDLAISVKKVLEETGIRPDSLILEITETAIIRNAEMSARVLQEIKNMGIRLYMDDFGTGYSSLSCLHQFPLTGLKIDQSFVRRAGESRDYAAIVQAIVVLARNLGMSLVAEGIETPEQLALLLAMECDKGQGFYFAKPMDAAAAGEYIRRQGNTAFAVRKAG